MAATNTVLLIYLNLLLILSAHSYKLVIDPAEIKQLPEGSSIDLRVYLTNCTDAKKSLDLKLESVGEILQHAPCVNNVTCCNNSTEVGCGTNFKVKGTLLGFGELYISMISNDSNDEEGTLVNIGVVRPPADLKDSIYLYGIIVGAVLNTLGFGIGLDLQKVKKYLTRPIALALATCCQFILMPLLGFTMTFIINRNRALEFGLFAGGVTPGGGASNVWAFLLGGDIDLSITLTFISTIASLAFISLWMYTAGAYLIQDSSISLPFSSIAQTLAYVVVPVLVGILINRFLPKVAKVLVKIQRVFLAIFIVFIITMGIYANIYAFRMVFGDYQLALGVFAIPYIGGFCGLLIGLLAKLDKPLAITIGIETAVQNTNIATIILRTSLPQPWADISSAVPICLNLATPIIFTLLVGVRVIYLKFYKKEEEDEDDKEVIEAEDRKVEDSPTAEGRVNPACSQSVTSL